LSGACYLFPVCLHINSDKLRSVSSAIQCQRCILCWFWLPVLDVTGCWCDFTMPQSHPSWLAKKTKKMWKKLSHFLLISAMTALWEAGRPKASPESAPGTFLHPCPEIFQLSNQVLIIIVCYIWYCTVFSGKLAMTIGHDMPCIYLNNANH
jgi:hypothetical protein